MSFNDILVASGGFGLYQKFLTFGCLAYSLAVVSYTYWSHVFILLIPPHRCKISENDTEWSTVFNTSTVLQSDLCHVVRGDEIVNCEHGYVYDFSVNFPTYASENDLVCEHSYKVFLIHTVYYIGNTFGILFFGYINDKYGRRRAYQLSVALLLIADVATYFSPSYIIFVMARFLSSAGDCSVAAICFVLVIEHIIPSKRRLCIFVWSFVYALSSLALIWISYFTYYWGYILMLSWIPTTGAIIMSYFIPESPSWLLSKGRVEEAVKYIQKMARVNGKNLSKDYIHGQLEKMKSGKEEEGMSSLQIYVAVLKSPNLRKRIFFMGILWFIACACYNGNTLEFHYLPFNMYLTYTFGALAEIPGNLIVVMVLDKFGRRWTNSAFFIVGGLCGIISANVQSTVIMLILVMVMRNAYASAYDITFSFSSEVVPTIIRGRAISFIRACGGLGSAVAPFLVSLAQQDPLLPLMCFGILAVSGGLLMLTLPETAYQHLPQTLEEGENFGKGQSFWLCPFATISHEEKGDTTFGKSRSPVRSEKEIECLGIKSLPKY